ncbi:MAG: ComEA family DNA-binding protein [Clostridia bacterium]|nr:ComEA family DNA-binding protein [Clostridia bacterium]
MRIKLFGRVFYLPGWLKFAAVVSVFVLLAILGFSIRSEKRIEKENPILALEANSPGLSDSASSSLPEAAKTSAVSDSTASDTMSTSSPYNSADHLTVYVVGCVTNPSVVTVPKGSIIQDAVTAAGGFTENADLTRINLAYPLSDNMMIKIPSVTDSAEKLNQDENGWFVTTVPAQTSSSENSTSDTDIETITVNINTADIKELCILPGIGESTAQKIIDYREKNGPYEHIEDIMNVTGIKQSRFDSIKDFITT